jgi:serine/threonine protein phosphatase PrpC
MRFSTANLSERGPRTENEDSVCVKSFGSGSLAVAIADGLGGHAGGIFASQLAVRTFVDFVIQRQTNDLGEVAKEIHAEIQAEQQKDPQHRSMATTLSAAVFRSGLMEFVHCGDSRIVVARAAGIKRLTTDHSEAQRLFASGQLTKKQLETYPRKHVLESALGMKGMPSVQTGNFPVLAGDRIFFTTDGLHNKIALREQLYLSRRYRATEDVMKCFSAEMTKRNPEDNYSCVAVFVLP